MAKKSRKVFATTATAALVASAVAPIASSAAGFSDVTKPEYKEAINALADAGILNGYENGTFKPENKVTRGEVAKVITLIRHLEDGTKTPFKDVKDGYWSTKFINSLYAAKLVNGYEDGTFKPEGNVTRAEFAKLVVDAYGLTLTNSATPFTDVKAGNWATPYIQTAYANGLIKGVTASKFDPSAPIKRGDLAILLHRADSKFGDVIGNNFPGVELVKATNNTTVEVTFKEEVKDVAASNFSIDGLTISNAAVKQTDSKTVVLTTSAQEGGKLYTVKSGAATLGKFKGISAVIPTSIKTVSTSVQGVVGKEVTVKADIGVKQAGVPVTFNVAAGATLNKNQVEEVYTDENGIATYSYTQYAAGNDTVAIYPTGAPSVRSFATVYWGVDNILTLSADDKKGNALNNGEKKVYKVVYKDAYTGKPVADKDLHVTFAENVDVTIDKTTKATVDGVNPYQLTNGQKVYKTVRTNSKGEATFTVSGVNTKATPVVFVDSETKTSTGNHTLEATELQVSAEQLTFAAAQAAYDIQITRDGGEEAAVGVTNGREYTLVVKNKDGKAAAGETVNVGLNEILDKVISTETSAYFVDEDGNKLGQGPIKVKLDSKGEGSFVIASDYNKDYATPIAWIDINSSNSSQNGILEEGEPFKIADKSYFVDAKRVGSSLKAYNPAGKAVTEFKGNEAATFKYFAVNQSGKSVDSGTISAHFQVNNTGSENVNVYVNDKLYDTVSPGRYITIDNVLGTQPSIKVQPAEDKTTSVEVSAYGVTTDSSKTQLGHQEAKASFTSTKEVGEIHTGLVTAIDTDNQKITFDGKTPVSYKGASFKNINGNDLLQSEFENHIKERLAEGKTSKVTIKKDGDKLTVSIIEDVENAPQIVKNQVSVSNAVNAASTAIDGVPTTGLKTGETLVLPTEVDGATIAWTSDNVLLSNSDVKVASVEATSTTTLTVGKVEKETTVTLKGTFTKGTGSDKVEQTKTYQVKLVPTSVPDVTRGELSTQISEAKAMIDGDKAASYTEASVKALQKAIVEAESVVGLTSPNQAEMNKVSKDLTDAVSALKKVAVIESAKVDGQVLTLTFTEAAPEAALISGKIGEVAGTVATVEGKDKELKITFDAETAKVENTSEITVVVKEGSDKDAKSATYVVSYNTGTTSWGIAPKK